jgi:4-amino-4-deoxy-L-arabinose transferase-like glycosyltransferase
MGQSILDGYLPYVKIWDNKPPLLFAIFALFIKFLGHNIAGIRTAGTLCVVISAYFLYLSIYKDIGKKIALITSLLSIYLMSLLDSGQAVTSEQIALLGVMSAFYLLKTKNNHQTIICLALGLLLGCATLIRLNLIYLSLFVGIWLLFSYLKTKESKLLIFKNATAYIVGHLLIFIATFLPYLYQGNPYEWWHSVILAPLAYSKSQGYFLNSILFLVRADVLVIPGILGIIISLIYFYSHQHKLSFSLSNCYVLNAIFYASISFSIVKSGATFGHYLIQIAPFLALGIGLILQPIYDHRYYQKIALFLVAVVIVIGLTKPSFPLGNKGYAHLLERVNQQQSVWEGASFTLANYLEKQEHPHSKLFILGSHLTHWHTNTLPLSKCSTHPSNIFRESLLPFCGMNGRDSTSFSEIQYIFQQKPDYLLIDNNRFKWIESRPNMLSFWQSFVQKNYELTLEDYDYKVYQLLEFR